MREPIDPDFEYNRGPVLWGAAAVFILGFIVILVLDRPGWLVPASLVGGGVAAARSGYYQSSGNNGALAVGLGVLLLTPFHALSRAMVVASNDGDIAFQTLALGLAWGAIVIIAIVPLGYLGAVIVDFTRKRIGGPLGFEEGGDRR